MRNVLKENIGSVEMGFRFMLGAALIAATMFGNEMFGGELVIWMALLSVYPVVTAIMAWDPVYAIGHNLVEKAKAAFPHKPTALPAN